MPTKRLFRSLIVAQVFLLIVSFVLSLFDAQWLPEQLRLFVEQRDNVEIKSSDFLMLVLIVPLLVLLIISTIGLYRFWRPARNLFLFTNIAGFTLSPFMGPVVLTGITDNFLNMSTFLSGMILAFAYVPPFRELFDNTAKLIPPPNPSMS